MHITKLLGISLQGSSLPASYVFCMDGESVSLSHVGIQWPVGPSCRGILHWITVMCCAYCGPTLAASAPKLIQALGAQALGCCSQKLVSQLDKVASHLKGQW